MNRAFRSIDKLNFGMYKGFHLGIVYAFDPQYVEWCVNKVDGFTIIDFDFLKTVGVLNPNLNWQHRMIGDISSTMPEIGIFDDFDDVWVNFQLGGKPKYTFDNSSIKIIRRNQDIYGKETRMYNPYEGEYYP